MKKLYAITVCILLCMAGTAQPYAPWEPSQGSPNTITLHDRTTALNLGHYDGSLFLLEVHFKDGSGLVKKVVKR